MSLQFVSALPVASGPSLWRTGWLCVESMLCVTLVGEAWFKSDIYLYRSYEYCVEEGEESCNRERLGVEYVNEDSM